MTDFFQPVSAVILILSLLGGTLYFLRRRGAVAFRDSALPFGRPGSPRQLRVLERIPLGPQHALHLVRVGDRLLLIATSPGACQMMDSPVQELAG